MFPGRASHNPQDTRSLHGEAIPQTMGGSFADMGQSAVAHHLSPAQTEIDGRAAAYSVGGSGFPVLFLHGWGLAQHSYRRALKRLVAQGCRVYAPTLPGFGGTADLPSDERSIGGYGAWVHSFIEQMGIDEPVLLVGHSFGGGIAIRLAHDYPETVRYLVLLNSVGATFGSDSVVPGTVSALNRPGWMWALRAIRDPSSVREGVQLVRAAAEDLVPNLLKHPRALWEVGLLARQADLGAELQELRRREMPVLVLWGDHDRVLPTGSFEALCQAVGSEGQVVSGSHSWLLADPDAFGEVMSNVVEVAAQTGSTKLEQLMEGTSIPGDVVKRLIGGAAPLWLISESPQVLAGDLALCHPPLGPDEIRAVARPSSEPGSFRLTVVAHDRPGLLAETTAVLASEGLSVIGASATTWVDQGIALHSLTLDAPENYLPEEWDLLGRRLRSIAAGEPALFLFEPGGRAHVRTTPQAMGRSLLSVTAPDQLGLLWAICEWLAANGVSIEAARVSSENGMANDEFVVAGRFDPSGLQRRLTADDRPIWRRFSYPGADLVNSLLNRLPIP